MVGGRGRDTSLQIASLRFELLVHLQYAMRLEQNIRRRQFFLEEYVLPAQVVDFCLERLGFEGTILLGRSESCARGHKRSLALKKRDLRARPRSHAIEAGAFFVGLAAERIVEKIHQNRVGGNAPRPVCVLATVLHNEASLVVRH